jgi:fucose 4-O-acetylase-like acetyltransferase
MPLFIFLSGLTANKSYNSINYNFILKKFKSLIIPFFMWAFVSSFLVYKLNLMMNLNHILEIVKTPDKGLWFLWSLFFINILYFFSLKISSGVTPLLLTYFFFLAIIFFYNVDNLFAFKQTVGLLPFFVLGY